MTSKIFDIKRESCPGCGENILCHHKIMLCENCDTIYHASCSERHFKYDHTRNKWICNHCSISIPKHYNPFNLLNYDKYDNNQSDHNEVTDNISKILNSCKIYDKDSFKPKLSEIKNTENVNSTFSIVFNNIDGNLSNFDPFTVNLAQYSEQFSVIAIAETNISEANKDQFSINGYNSEYNSKIHGKSKGSGIGMYIFEDLQYSRLEQFCNCTPNLETLFVEISNAGTQKPMSVGVIYRPPNGDERLSLQELDFLMKNLPSENVTITGDFNIDLLSPNSSSDFEQIIYSNNFIPLISLATHEKPGCNGTLIDNILTNSTENFLISGVLDSRVSHHHPIFSYYSIQPVVAESPKLPSPPQYDYCESKMSSFLDDIKNDISDCDFSYDEGGFNKFCDTLDNMIEHNFRTDTSCLTSKRNRLFNPWITSGIIASVHTKTHLYKKWKKTCTDSNPLGCYELYNQYKDYRKILCKLIKSAKKSYYSKKFTNAAGNIKKTWGLINELRGKSKSNIKSSFIVDGNLVTDRRQIADGFNAFFSSIAQKMNTKVASSTLRNVDQPNTTNQDYTRFLSGPKIPRNVNSIFIHHCNNLEILEIIKELDNNKASNMNISVLKSCSVLLVRHLVSFFNSFLDSGIFPLILKRGQITPIFKKGDPRHFDNYRPVSTLPIFGKILEKVIYNRLCSFLTSMNILFENQFGFRKMHSTSHAINFSIDNILTEIESKNHVIGIFIDLSKAFDTIEHNKLINKLEYYGIRGNCLSLIKSYLSDRTQKTKFSETLSEECSVKYGVPQGSVLGPLLFLIYINDIINSTTLGNFIMFADDTNIFIADPVEENAYYKANLVLECVSEYMKLNQLHINVGKSCYIHFKPCLNRAKQKCARATPYNSSLKVRLCGKKLTKVRSAKFLGVVVDDELSWEPHVDYLITKLNSCIVTIKRIKPFIPKGEYIKIYNALFLSHITYGISCWGGIPSYKLNKIFSIQKRCVRLLFGKQFTFDHHEFYLTCARTRSFDEQMEPKDFCLEHTKPLFNEHNLLSLKNLYEYHIFMETFKILKHKTPISICNKFNLCPKNNKLLLMIPRVRLDVSQQNFVYQATQIWNERSKIVFNRCDPEISGIVIPGSSENSDLGASVSVIKSKLKTHLLESQKIGHSTDW